MSRLNVANFRHPDGTADNISLDSSGRVGIGTTTPADYNGNANNLVVGDGSTNEGMTIASTNEGSIFFADGTTGTDEYAGYLQYHHSDNHLRVGIASTEQMRLDSSGNLRFNSGYGSVATAYGVRAFAVFDGASPGSPDITRNVSTIGDTAAGRFTINFTNNMPDVHYAMAGSAGNHGTTQAMRGIMPDATFTTSAAAIRVVHTDTTVADDDYIAVMFVR